MLLQILRLVLLSLLPNRGFEPHRHCRLRTRSTLPTECFPWFEIGLWLIADGLESASVWRDGAAWNEDREMGELREEVI